MQAFLVVFCSVVRAEDTTQVRIHPDIDSVVLRLHDSLLNKPGNNVLVTSVPENGFVTLDGKTLEELTPIILPLSREKLSIEVYKDGYEPLITDLMMAEIQKKQVQFILRPLAPIYLNADSLGYTIQSVVHPIEPARAKNIEKKYMALAETFLILPLSQGLIAKLVLDDDNQREANVLVGAGIILTTGSYLLSKIFSKKKRNEIEQENIIIEKQNIDIKNSNKEIELLVRKVNAERIEKWEEESKDKGVVVINNIDENNK